MHALLLSLLSGTALAGAPIPDLAQIMADPAWVARSPHWMSWSDDSRSIWYLRQRPDSELEDWWTVSARGGTPHIVPPGPRTERLPPGGQRSPDGRFRITVSHGAVWVADHKGRAWPVSASDGTARTPRFLTDGRVAWRAGDTWVAAKRDGSGTVPVVSLSTADDPDHDAPDGFLEEQQQRLFPSLAADRAEDSARRNDSAAHIAADPTRDRTVYLGDGRQIRTNSLGPDGRWLVVEDAKEGTNARRDPMPDYVTASGYVETRNIRPKVGTDTIEGSRIWLVSVASGPPVAVSLDDLPGRHDDPLAAIRATPLPDDRPPRPLQLEHHAWSLDGRQVALQLHSFDQKDRWTVVVTMPAEPTTDPVRPTLVEHLHDDAWVNWDFNALGWLPDGTLWLQSEASGYGHLHRWDGTHLTPLTSGAFEARRPEATRDGRWLYFKANVDSPVEYDVYRVPTAGGPIEAITRLGGMTDFWLSPDERSLLLKHSKVLQPPELYVQPARPGGTVRQLTHTVESAWSDIDWVAPDIVPIPSTHTDQPIWSRVYQPDGPPPEDGRPAVIFVHGAGYLQNSHAGWSGYAREMMFHSMLVDHGYVVLDMDYRASEGYGRDWRTAIYRQMGHPELEDLADGIAWATEHAHVDPERVGVYGGSYGGFITFMALFKQPGLWAAGAALRPVTDWSNYNDGYTRAILNTPEDDPEAYQRSSPIEHADGLEDPLLICHGMVDSNVPYQDSVRLAQRLIELRKTDWELASYPREGHGFTHPESWWDEYRRIFELFERTIGGTDAP